MRRGPIIAVVILVAVFIAADRITLAIAETQIADRVQKSQALTHRPNVSIKGFPFLTQVVGGRYDELQVTVRDITRNNLTVDKLSVNAHGVSVPLSKVLSGSVREVPVDRADAVVSVGYTHLNDYISRQLGEVLKVSGDKGKLRLTGTLPVPPRISLSADATIDVTAGAITLRPAALSTVLAKVAGLGVAASTVEKFFTVRLPISQLPFGIQLQRATVTPAAVVIAASATGLTIRAPSG